MSVTRLGRSLALALAGLLVVAVAPVYADTCACDPIQPFLAVDRLGRTHATYRNAGTPGIVYSTNTSGSWSRRRITSAKDEPAWIAVDAQRAVYIVFRRESGDSVNWYYITNRNGSWASALLPFIPDAAYRPRIDVAPDRTLYISYETDADGVFLATRASSGWQTRRVDVSSGYGLVMRVDDGGFVHLAFRQCLNDGVGTCDGEGAYHETNTTGAWVQERLSTSQYDVPTDIEVGDDGSVHVVYWEDKATEDLLGGLFYVTNRTGTWVTKRFATYGRMAELALDSEGYPRIVYTRIDDGYGLFYATNRPGYWTWWSIYSDWALYPSMGIDAQNRLHVVFMRMEKDPGIYYTSNKSGSWTPIELMD